MPFASIVPGPMDGDGLMQGTQSKSYIDGLVTELLLRAPVRR